MSQLSPHGCAPEHSDTDAQVNTVGFVSQHLFCVFVSYFEVVDQQLVEGGVSIEVNKETFIIHHSNAR